MTKTNQNPLLAIVIPCYNEQELVRSTTETLLSVKRKLVLMDKISNESFILFVDDGSVDNTWDIIADLHKEKPNEVKAISFTRNFGNQKAIIAGLLESKEKNVDCVLTIDADLQQDENSIEEFIDKYKAGADIVAGIRRDRKTDSFFKKWSAICFYKLINILGGKITPHHSDFRLIGRRTLEILSSYKEVNLFLRGIFNEFGLKKSYVYFNVKPRMKGESKYNPLSLFQLAIQGITSFSIVPLRIVTATGLIIAVVSFIIGLRSLIDRWLGIPTFPEATTILSVTCFIGGLQILATGIIGEYLGQIFQEVKARPRFIIDKKLD